MTEDIKKEEVKEEETTETTEKVVEEAKDPSELEEAQARAEELENKYLRAHAEMQNIQRRKMKNVNNCKNIVVRIWQKLFCHHWIISNVLLPLKV